MSWKTFLTKHSPEFGSRVALNSMLLTLLMTIICAISVSFEGASSQWAVMAGGIVIILMLVLCFFIIYYRKDHFLLFACGIIAVFFLLCVAAVIYESYLLVTMIIGDNDETYSIWNWIAVVMIILFHIILASLAGANATYIFKLRRVTKETPSPEGSF